MKKLFLLCFLLYSIASFNGIAQNYDNYPTPSTWDAEYNTEIGFQASVFDGGSGGGWKFQVTIENAHFVENGRLIGSGTREFLVPGVGFGIKLTSLGVQAKVIGIWTLEGFERKRFVWAINVKKPQGSVSGPVRVGNNREATYTSSNRGENVYFDVDPNYFNLISNPNGILNLKSKNKAGMTAVQLKSKLDQSIVSELKVEIYPDSKVNTNQNLVCSNNLINYSIDNVPENVNISWTGSNLLSLVSGQGTSNATFRANSSGNGQGSVKAELKVDGKTYLLENNAAWVGVPNPITGINGFERDLKIFSPNSYLHFAAGVLGATDYTWTVIGGKILESYGGTITVLTDPVPITGNKPFHITVGGTNGCGTGLMISRNGEIQFGEAIIFAPASPTGIDDINSNQLLIKSIKVYSTNGLLVYSTQKTISLKEFNIKELGLSSGIYIVETTNENGKITREKVFIDKE